MAVFLLKTVYPSVVTVEDNNIVFDTSGMIFSYFLGRQGNIVCVSILLPYVIFW